MGLLEYMMPAAEPPAPTTGPSIVHLQNRIFGRAVLETCGFIDEEEGLPATCPAGRECVWNSINNVQGCCQPPITLCDIITACYDSTSLSACDRNCSSNSYIAKCSDPLAPYCATDIFVGSGNPPVSAFGCGTLSGATYSIYSTFIGESASASGDPEFSSLLGQASSLLAAITATESGRGRARPTGASDSGDGFGIAGPTGPSGSAAATRSGAAGGGGDNSGGNGGGNGGGGGGLSPGITAAIAVPSAVGGLAIIGGIVFLILWLRRRNSKKPANTSGAQPMMTQEQYPPQEPPPSGTPFASEWSKREAGARARALDASTAVGTASDVHSNAGASGTAALNKENLDNFARDNQSGEPRSSEELANQRRLSDDKTAFPDHMTYAGQTTTGTADSFRPRGA